MKKLSLIVCLILFSKLSLADELVKLNVYLDITSQDIAGQQLAYALKEKIRRSVSMALVDRSKDGFLKVNLVTLNPDKQYETNNRTIYSVVWTAETFHSVPVTMFLTSSVGICGVSRIEQCADTLTANTDEQASLLRGLIQSATERSSAK